MSENVPLQPCAPNDDSDQPVHSCSFIRIVTGRICNNQWYKVSSCGQRWSVCVNAQADLSLRWTLQSEGTFSYTGALLITSTFGLKISVEYVHKSLFVMFIRPGVKVDKIGLQKINECKCSQIVRIRSHQTKKSSNICEIHRQISQHGPIRVFSMFSSSKCIQQVHTIILWVGGKCQYMRRLMWAIAIGIRPKTPLRSVWLAFNYHWPLC